MLYQGGRSIIRILRRFIGDSSIGTSAIDIIEYIEQLKNALAGISLSCV
jgi:hypothetical protein